MKVSRQIAPPLLGCRPAKLPPQGSSASIERVLVDPSAPRTPDLGGTATTVARGDHVHPTTGVMTTDHVANAITGFNAAPVALGDSAAAGNASDKEIAATLKINEGTVMSRLHRARQRLVLALKDLLEP